MNAVFFFAWFSALLFLSNKSKKWKYGYNKEHDIIVISKTGKIGEILEIQNLRIALPPVPVQVHGLQENKWKKINYPFYNEFENTKYTLNDKSQHAGRPVISGEKWIATKWIRESKWKPNIK